MFDKSLQIAWNTSVGLLFLGVLATTMALRSVSERW